MTTLTERPTELVPVSTLSTFDQFVGASGHTYTIWAITTFVDDSVNVEFSYDPSYDAPRASMTFDDPNHPIMKIKR